MNNESMRQTGRTFRTLLNAITKTSEIRDGEVVVFVSNSIDEASVMAEKTAGLLAGYSHSDAYYFSARTRRIKIIGGGTIIFTSLSESNNVINQTENDHNLKLVAVIKDHYVLEKETAAMIHNSNNNVHTINFKHVPLLEFFDHVSTKRQNVGKLEIKDGKLVFTGEVDTSAKIFFEQCLKELVDAHAKQISQSLVDDINNSCMFEWDDDRWHEGQGYLADIQELLEKKYGNQK